MAILSRRGILVELLLIVVLLASISCANAQENCTSSRVLLEDADVRQLAANLSSKACSVITGNLNIGSSQLPCSITTLSPITLIVEIQGSLSIQSCSTLTRITDFQSLVSVTGSISIYFNQNLAMIGGFSSLRNVTNLQISQNPKLQRVTAFSRLSVISGYLEIDRNPSLYDISGFRSLQMIQGAEVILGHVLTLTYNTNLTDLSVFSSLSNIQFGTIHIEGNTRLCYAGYPQWRVGSYPLRLEVVGGVDVGIDWRTRLDDNVPIWQYTWRVVDGGYPTLLIQNNAPSSDCGEASCDASCPPGAGCLGPNDASLCGTCRQLDDGSNTCNAVPVPSPGGVNSTAIALGIIIPLLVIILLILLGLGVWGAVVLAKRWRVNKQGSFDVAPIVYTSPKSGDTDTGGVKLVSRSSAEELVEPTPIGSSATRKGLRRQPMDNVIMASYQANTSSLSRTKPKTTPTRAAPTVPTIRAAPPPSNRGGGGGVKQSSPWQQGPSHSPPTTISTNTNTPPPASTVSHPMTAKRAPGSRSPSQSTRPIVTTTTATTSGVASSSAKSNGGRSQPSGAGSSAGKSAQASSASVHAASSSVKIKSTQPRTASAVNGSRKGNGVRAQPKSEEDWEREQDDTDAEVPMDFPKDQIKLGREFGVGDFGKVFQAEAKKLLPRQKKTTVVVKQLKEGATNEERDVFLRPVEAMKILRHRNVLSLLGVCMQGPSILVLLEYCAQGNFKTFLVRKRREAAAMKQSKELVKMACDMAAGLYYLHTKSIAHNDFAVRSCMVTEDGVVKLGDYGITRQTFKEDYYSRGENQKAWPVRWMAPEQIIVQGRNVLDSLPVSLQANIWSFGVALWEVCSFAQWPYEEMGNEEVIQTVKSTNKCFLDNPLQPNDLIAPLFEVCQLCWQPFDSRPSMSELLTTLKDILAGVKVRWPSKKDPATAVVVGVAGHQLPGESPSVRGRSGSSSLGYRPKRPAPLKPPSGGGTSRQRPQRRDDKQSLLISNPAAHSQEDPEIERDLVANGKSTSLSQDAATSAYSMEKEKASSKSYKLSLKRDLSSSTEPLLQSSSSLSAEDESGSKAADILPVPVDPLPPSTGGGGGEATIAATITDQKKRKHRKSGEFKNEGEGGKQKSKSKRKRKTEHDTSEKRTPKSEEEDAQAQAQEEQRQETSVGAFKMMNEPSAEEGELPLPQEIAEAAAINDAVIAGAGVGDGGPGPGESKGDFILEPPLRFSQSSVDYLDEFGDIDDSGPLSFDFAPPTAPTDDELEDERPHPPPPPITSHEEKQIQQIHKPPAAQQQRSSEKKKKLTTESLEAKKLKRGSAVSSKPQKKTEASREEMEDEWQGLDYPVKNPPLRRAAAAGGGESSRSPQGRERGREKGRAAAGAGQTRGLVFPRDWENKFDEFAHRDAMEEPESGEEGGGGVVLDDDVAALLW